MKNNEKLCVYYSKKEDDLIFYNPNGRQTTADAWWLWGNVFNKEFVEEIKRRGYDIETMRFEISPKLPNFRKFETMSKQYGYVDSKE